jgi:hypothetical protein
MSTDPITALVASWAKPIRTPVDGSPYQPGQRVKVVELCDDSLGKRGDLYEGQTGTVEYLEYSCGCGQRYPFDPMIGIRFDQPGLALEEFWAEELAEVTP